MPDRLFTVNDILQPGNTAARPGLFDLLVLQRTLQDRIALLDERVEEKLDFIGSPTDPQVAEVDVLCAAIAEAQELLDQARREANRHVERSHQRRTQPRRWA